MNQNSSITWYQIIAWAYPVKVFTKGAVHDPLTRAVYILRENFQLSDIEIQAHIGMPMGMIQSAINQVVDDNWHETDVEPSGYHSPLDGWCFWCPVTEELLPEIWTDGIDDTGIRFSEYHIDKPRKERVSRAVDRLQHSSFVKLMSEHGQQESILKLELRGARPIKQVLYVPVEFRGHDVICWKPQFCKSDVPMRSLSKIALFEEKFIKQDDYQRSKDAFETKQNHLLLQETEYRSMDDFDNDIQSWCSEQFSDLWQDGSSQVSREIFSTRKQAQMDFYFNNGWQPRGQKWGTLLEWMMKRIASALIQYCDGKYESEILRNLSRVKEISSYYYKFFTKSDLSLQQYLRRLTNNHKNDKCSIDGYSQIFCLALATDEGWKIGSDLHDRFPDFIKNLINARDNRNLCMHVKQDVCNVELFIEQMIYISKVALYFEQHIHPKMGK